MIELTISGLAESLFGTSSQHCSFSRVESHRQCYDSVSAWLAMTGLWRSGRTGDIVQSYEVHYSRGLDVAGPYAASGAQTSRFSPYERSTVKTMHGWIKQEHAAR